MMRIQSWNINGLRSALASCALDPIRADPPDVLCLQETRTDTAPELVPGFHHIHNPGSRPGYAGTALAARQEPASVALGLPGPAPDEEGRVISAAVGGVRVVNVYVPRPVGGRRRMAARVRFDRALITTVRALGGDASAVVCGDFNALLDPEDVHAGSALRDGTEAGFAAEERDLLLTLLEIGYVDAFRHANPDAREAYTWWSPRAGSRESNRGWRLDYFFVSPSLAPRIASARHLTGIEGSDHCPIELELAL